MNRFGASLHARTHLWRRVRARAGAWELLRWLHNQPAAAHPTAPRRHTRGGLDGVTPARWDRPHRARRLDDQGDLADAGADARARLAARPQLAVGAGGPRGPASRAGGTRMTCFNCRCDHLARDCPNRGNAAPPPPSRSSTTHRALRPRSVREVRAPRAHGGELPRAIYRGRASAGAEHRGGHHQGEAPRVEGGGGPGGLRGIVRGEPLRAVHGLLRVRRRADRGRPRNHATNHEARSASAAGGGDTGPTTASRARTWMGEGCGISCGTSGKINSFRGEGLGRGEGRTDVHAITQAQCLGDGR